MRKAILSEMGAKRPWLETVEMLQAKGIPLNLILHEANEYGKRRSSSLPNVKVHTPLPATASDETEVKP